MLTVVEVGQSSLLVTFENFPDVLTDVLPKSSITGTAMRIYLTDGDKKPIKVLTARQIPIHLMDKAEEATKQLIDNKAITPQLEPTDWCAPGFFIIKPNGELRLVVDFTGLNKYVKRPIHVFPTSNDIIAGLDMTSRYFAKLDATQGHHQVPLDEESSKLTTFLLPSGRYRFLRAPMGLSCSSDEFCRRSDSIINGLAGIRKLVDDILVQALTLDVLKARMEALLLRCKEHNFTLSQKKFEIGKSVHFTGFTISHEGVFPDEQKLQGIQDFFPPPPPPPRRCGIE